MIHFTSYGFTAWSVCDRVEAVHGSSRELQEVDCPNCLGGHLPDLLAKLTTTQALIKHYRAREGSSLWAAHQRVSLEAQLKKLAKQIKLAEHALEEAAASVRIDWRPLEWIPEDAYAANLEPTGVRFGLPEGIAQVAP